MAAEGSSYALMFDHDCWDNYKRKLFSFDFFWFFFLYLMYLLTGSLSDEFWDLCVKQVG